MTTIERFRSKVVTSDGCWLWRGQISATGYARMKIDGRDGYAHRFSYEMFIGPVPDGLQVDHLCHVRSCVNPEHLEAVSCAENLRRRMPFDIPIKTHCVRGHEFTPENTRRHPSRPSERVCRECDLDRKRRNEKSPAPAARATS